MTKGIHNSHWANSGSFKKGLIPWNKNKKGIHMSPESEFKKGFTPWNKGLKLEGKFPTMGHHKPHSEESKKLISKNTLKGTARGSNHYAWRGGVSDKYKDKLAVRRWDSIRKEVYKRDNWTCQICDKKCHADIQCHHIIPYRISLDDRPSNLITLCRSCHVKQERLYYKNIETRRKHGKRKFVQHGEK